MIAPTRSGDLDHVTGFPNRAQLLNRLSSSVIGSDRFGQSSTLILVTLADAQHFNQLLRALGHEFADDFIRAGALRVASMLPPSVQIFNVSVLSFAFLVEVSYDRSLDFLCKSISHIFCKPIILDNIPITSRAGIGIVEFHEGISDPAETLRAALTAAQDSRHQQQPFSYYNAKTDSAHLRAFQILTDLPFALQAGNQIELFYQPRVELASGCCVAVEALMRWNHPALGWVSPAELFPLIESTALIKPVTEYVLRTALQQLALWSKLFTNLCVSVNVSPNNFNDPELVEYLKVSLALYNLCPSRLELEFTEGAVAADDTATLSHLQEVRSMGATIAIDDFGSGYSNMAYLTKIPADFIKVDKSFVRHVESSRQSAFLFKKMIELAHGLGFKVVGEGVETAEAYDFLMQNGCEQAQGYFISRPLPVDQITVWLTENLVGSNARR